MSSYNRILLKSLMLGKSHYKLSKKSINVLIVFFAVFIIVMLIKPIDISNYGLKFRVIFTLGCSLVASIGYLLTVELSNKRDEDTWLYLNDDIKYFIICDAIIVLLLYGYINALIHPKILAILAIEDEIIPIDYLLLKIVLFAVSITLVLAVIFNVNSQFYFYRLLTKESINKIEFTNNSITNELTQDFNNNFNRLLENIIDLNIINIKKESGDFTNLVLTSSNDNPSFYEKSYFLPFQIFKKHFKNDADFYVSDESIFNLRFIEFIDPKKRFVLMTHFKLKIVSTKKECEDIEKRLSIIDS